MGCDRNREVCDVKNFLEEYSNKYTNNSKQKSGFPECYMFGHAYTPNQVYTGKSFTPENGLQHGTMFPELVSPYMPLDSMKVIETLRNERREY